MPTFTLQNITVEELYQDLGQCFKVDRNRRIQSVILKVAEPSPVMESVLSRQEQPLLADDQNRRSMAFQRLLNIKPKKLTRNSTDVIREEREKLDTRNKQIT